MSVNCGAPCDNLTVFTMCRPRLSDGQARITSACHEYATIPNSAGTASGTPPGSRFSGRPGAPGSG